MLPNKFQEFIDQVNENYRKIVTANQPNAEFKPLSPEQIESVLKTISLMMKLPSFDEFKKSK
jgi:hypothetical protein